MPIVIHVFFFAPLAPRDYPRFLFNHFAFKPFQHSKPGLFRISPVVDGDRPSPRSGRLTKDKAFDTFVLNKFPPAGATPPILSFSNVPVCPVPDIFSRSWIRIPPIIPSTSPKTRLLPLHSVSGVVGAVPSRYSPYPIMIEDPLVSINTSFFHRTGPPPSRRSVSSFLFLPILPG